MKRGIKVKQHDTTDCGPACLVSIAAYYNLKLPISKVRYISGTDKRGTNLYGLIEGAKELGFYAKGVKVPLETLPNIQFPAIAHLKIKDNLSHFVVIYRLSKTHVKIMDPADGTINNVLLEDFIKTWTNILIVLQPNEFFEPGDKKHSSLKRFIFLIRPHRAVMIQAFVGSIFYTILGLSFAIYVQKITDYVLIDGNLKLLNVLSLGMVFILLVNFCLGLGKGMFALRTGQQIDYFAKATETPAMQRILKLTRTLPSKYWNGLMPL